MADAAPLKASELRDKYLRFFESKRHLQVPSGSLIPYDVTGRLDESLLFNGAGMIQFKPYFRGIAEPPNKRLITVQKCVRTGDIEEVGDLTHLIFFEMLDNFSFGDYFKKEAIALSWEFITSPEWLGLDPKKVSFTVFEEDDDAYGYWAEWLESVGIDPSTRIFRLDDETNYWPAGSFTKGPPGLCGPNSEMFYWTQGEPPSAPYTREDWIRDEAESKWLEFWNDVFIQFEWQGEPRNPDRPQEGYVKVAMPPLPFQSIDTGMGLERTATVLGGLKSLYDIDIFQPILRKIEEVSPLGYRYGSDSSKDVATRIIADHIRTAVFCIADGVLPGNTGRGYVLRRLIRRAVLKGQRVLGIEKPFFHLVYEGVLESMGDHYRELHERRDVIAETLKNEEALFRRTLHNGLEVFRTQLGAFYANLRKERGSTNYHQDMAAVQSPDDFRRLTADFEPLAPFPGVLAFDLYETFGFPLEVTKELCAEAGIGVDEPGYEEALVKAQQRSRAGTERESIYGGVQASVSVTLGGLTVTATGTVAPPPTDFRGYEQMETTSHIVGALAVTDPAEPSDTAVHIAIALDQTPFYAESGGQISDTGTIAGSGFEGRVVNVVKQQGVFVHEVEPVLLPEGVEAQAIQGRLLSLEVGARIDVNRRMRIMRNHTATHLLHAALRQVLGKHVTQAGSYVGPDHLRFDFTHGKAMTPEEMARVEVIVNEQALRNTPVTTYVDIPIAEAKERGAMALFGEKYGDKVRMVEIGDFSRELCGGTHLHATGEVGLFKITGESSAASGVRRIEAVTGEGAYAWVLEQTGAFYEAAASLRSSPKDVLAAIERLHEQLREERKRREKAETALARGESGGTSNETQEVKGVFLWTRKFEDVDQKIAASALDDAVAKNKNLVALAVVVSDRIQLICKAGDEAIAKGAHAGNLIKQIAPIVGGGGGGRAEFATAGGKDPSKVDEALAAAAGFLDGMIG